ncbi:serine hydrolase [Legionella sp. CNM-4043-24]|uniref:serine hydrolase n=1 Tax=Legionella sp. CNM-4043-24 TaxID=3421646 RepID=UPI00403B2EBD
MSASSYSATGRGDFHTTYNGQSVDELVIKYMEDNHIPELALAIVQAPYITRVVGYGLADTHSKRLVATNTVFNIGQITNAYTAVAIMQLKEEGKLELDKPLNQYLNGFDMPQKWANITIRDLFTHSSGIPDFSESHDFDFSRDYKPADIIALVKDRDLLFAPGTRVNKSATDFYLLGLVIEKTSGMSYQAYITKNQIDRVGLKQTFFINNVNAIKNEINNGTEPFKHSQFLNDARLINPTEPATGYSEVNETMTPVKPVSWSSTFSNSGIVASAEDISLWDIALAGDILIKNPEDRAFLYNPVSLKNSGTAPGNAGWFFNGHKGMMQIKGNIPGYSAFLSRFTAKDELVCVTLLANKGDLNDLDILSRKIAGAINARLAAPEGAYWSETIQSPYSTQQTADNIAAIIKAKGGKVFVRIDQSEEASKFGHALQETQVLLVGNPAKGTALMQSNPAIALDLPLRIMITTDSTGQTWVSFTNPIKLGEAYHLDDPKMQHLLREMYAALNQVCQKAVSP